MIPAGFETKHSKLYFGDSDESDYDDDDDFICENTPSKAVNGYNAANTNGTQIANDLYDGEQEDTSERNNIVDHLKNANFTKTNPTTKSGSFFHELNNNYYYDEKGEILDDLKTAILNKNLTHVTNLMEKHKLDANCLLKSNWTPIMYAATCGSFELVEYFVRNGADVNFSHGIDIAILVSKY